MENKFIHKLENIVILHIKTKNIDRLLNNIYKSGIVIFKAEAINKKEVKIEIYEKDIEKVKKISILNEIKILGYKGKRKTKDILSTNKTLIVSIVIGLMFLIFLSNCIFDVEINHTSTKLKDYIYKELDKNGIRKFQFRKSFNRLEKIKNSILENNKDKLEWLEIERIGTKYVIKLEERKINSYSTDYKFQDIIATNDGVIKKIIATDGEKVKEVNEYVKKGDTIISGSIYLNEELKGLVKATGTVYAEIWYNLSIEYPIIEEIKEETGNIKNTYSINFLDKSIYLSGKNNYLYSDVKRKYLIKNNILPISISKDKIYELNLIKGIYTEGESILNARSYSRKKIEEMLDDDEYIISDKVLNYRVNSNTIYMNTFYKVYANITGTKEIKNEEGE